MSIERRAKSRYPIELGVQYQVLGTQVPVAGAGLTVNVSSSGMLITAEHELTEGARIRVTLEWPTLLNGKTALQLVTTGKIVRRQDSKWGIAFDHYQFRTRKQKPAITLPAAAVATAGAPMSGSVSTSLSLKSSEIVLRNAG